MSEREVSVPDLPRGFAAVPREVLLNDDLSVSAKLVYAVMLSFAWDADECWPGIETMAARLGVSARTVQRATAELAEMGLLTIVRRGQGKTNLYRLHLWRIKNGQIGVSRDATVSPEVEEGEVEEDSYAAPAPRRVSDHVWDALVAVFGDVSNDMARGRRNKAVKLIRQSLDALGVDEGEVGVEIGRRAARYRKRYPDAAFTDMALASRWDELVGPAPAPTRENWSPGAPAEPELTPEQIAASRQMIRDLSSRLGRAMDKDGED